MIKITRENFKTITNTVWLKTALFDWQDSDGFRDQIYVKSGFNTLCMKWEDPSIKVDSFWKGGISIKDQKRHVKLLNLAIEEAEKMEMENRMKELKNLEYGR